NPEFRQASNRNRNNRRSRSERSYHDFAKARKFWKRVCLTLPQLLCVLFALMEYTDAPSTQTADTMLCPNCGQRLPKDAQACDQCDWKRESPAQTAEGTASDAMAALLSIVPGLGHVYKGYRGIGLLFAIGTLIVL